MKKLLSFIICIILAACIAIPVSAAGVNVSITSSSSVAEGSNITFTVSLSGSAGATSGSVSVSFDDNFELVSGEFLKSGARLSYFDPATNKGALTFDSATDMNGEYFKLVLRAKKVMSAVQNVNISVELKNGASTVGNGSASKSVSIICSTHSFGTWQNLNGTQHSRTCSVCGHAETANHTWNSGTVTKQPTCKDTGVKTFTCTACGATKTEAIAKTNNHSYGSWITTKAATCTAAGAQERTCSICGKKEIKSIVATGHSFGGWKVTKEATCTAGGIETRTCSKCNAKETRNTKALGHKFSSPKITKQPTCTEPGIESGTCTRCGQTTTQSIPAAGHKFGEWNQSKAPTCTEKGIEERVCSVCSQKETRETEALGHDFDNPIIVKEATISTTGLMEGTCKRCGETTQEIIPCLAEDQSTGILVEAIEGVFSDGTTTQFSAIAESDASYGSLKNALAHYASKFTAYQISFSNAPNGEYTLILPNDGKLTAENAVVCLIADNGTVTEKEFTVDDDGKIVVKADSEGIYAIVDKTAAGEEHPEEADGADISETVDKSNSTWIIVAIAVVVIAGAVAAVMMIRKRKNKISE